MNSAHHLQATNSQFAIVGNWKMNGSDELADSWLEAVVPHSNHNTWVGLCPSFVHLGGIHPKIKNSHNGHSSIHLGSQDVSAFEAGAYTSQISAAMLYNLGCEFSLIGHSEARQHLKQSDADLAQKIQQTVSFCQKSSQQFGVIFCVGEPLEVREDGNAEAFVKKQLLNSIKPIAGLEDLAFFWVAYEPIWAIGTGRNASVEQAEQMHQHILNCLKSLVSEELMAQMKVLYGGSVNEANSKELLSQQSISGVLVGGASLKPESFGKIVKSAIF